MRLDKALSHAGWGSRAELRKAIRAGRVSVDGAVLGQPDSYVDPTCREILLDGEDIDWREYYYIVMNKPAGYISATSDPREKTVLDLLPARYRRMGLFPVGRLDKDSTGLLLLTNNGALAHMLLSPSKHVPKTYEVSVDGEIDKTMPELFKHGLALPGGEVCLPADMVIIDNRSAVVTLYEGKYHQIKRMAAVFGLKVTRLHRVSAAGLALPQSLAEAEFEVIEESRLLSLLGVQFAQSGCKRFG